MKNLETELATVWNAVGIIDKHEAMATLIKNSHAKKATKEKALRDIARMSSNQLDKFATNFMLSGEGMKV